MEELFNKYKPVKASATKPKFDLPIEPKIPSVNTTQSMSPRFNNMTNLRYKTVIAGKGKMTKFYGKIQS